MELFNLGIAMMARYERESEIESLTQRVTELEALLQQKQDTIDALKETIMYYEIKEEYNAN